MNCALTNTRNFKMIQIFTSQYHISVKTRKNSLFPIFSELPEFRVLKFCPELERLTCMSLISILKLTRSPYYKARTL